MICIDYMCRVNVSAADCVLFQVGAMLESEEARWDAEGKRAYHAFSRFIFFGAQMLIISTLFHSYLISKGAGSPMSYSGESIQRVRPSAALSERKFGRSLEQEFLSGSKMMK